MSEENSIEQKPVIEEALYSDETPDIPLPKGYHWRRWDRASAIITPPLALDIPEYDETFCLTPWYPTSDDNKIPTSPITHVEKDD